MQNRSNYTTQRKNLLFSFGIAATMVAAIYALLGFWPFGDGTLLTGDLNGQYINFITDMWHRVRQGGFFYSFSKLCGGSTLGQFAYYTNSPFNLLYLLLPVASIPAAVQLTFLLRVGLTAASCCAFLQRHFDSASPLLIFASQGYALCGFCVGYSQNVIWMDVVLLAPLVLCALEQLVDSGRHWPFCGLLCLCIFLNFYTAWALCLFAGLYFLYHWVTSPRLDGQRSPKLFARRVGLLFASGGLAAGGALVLLLPALAEITQTKGELFQLAFSFAPRFPLSQLPYQLFFGNFFWSDVTNGLPLIYCGVFCAVLALAFFVGRFPLKEKLAAAGMLLALVLSFWVTGFDLVWHGFKQPVWFPYRYSFLFSLFLVLLAARVLTAGKLSRWAAAFCGVAGVVFLLGYWFTQGQERSVFKLAVTAAVWYLTIAFLCLRGRKKRLTAFASVAFCAIALLDMSLNSFLTLRKFENYTYSGFSNFYSQGSEVVNALQQQDTSLYRMEKNFMRSLNDPMLFSYWGISHFSSTKASTAKPLLEQLGYVNYTVYGWGSTAVADSLLGIKYLYSDGSRPVPDHYKPLKLDTSLAVYQNPYALPLAYLGSSDVLAVDAAAYDNTFALQNAIVKALFPQSSPALLPAANIAFDKQSDTVQLKFTAPTTGPCYLAIPGTETYEPADVKINGVLLGEYFTGDSLGGVYPLGSFEKGEQVHFELGIADAQIYHDQISIYSLDAAALGQITAQLTAQSPEALAIREGGRIDVTVTASAGADVLVLPFAYEDSDHWKLRIDGKSAALQPVFGGFMGVELTEGKHTVQLRYHHPGAMLGAVGSCISGGAALVWFITQRRSKKEASKK